MHFEMASAICFNLNQSKILSFANGLDDPSSLETGDNAEGNHRNSFVSFETGDNANGKHKKKVLHRQKSDIQTLYMQRTRQKTNNIRDELISG